MTAAGTPRLLAATPDSGIDHDLDADDLRLSARNYLYLSGTPFRALTEGEFTEDAIYNWSYPDEQAAKKAWDADKARDPAANPYRELPQMQMFTYALSEMATAEVGYHPDGMFDLSGYFEASKHGRRIPLRRPGQGWRVPEYVARETVPRPRWTNSSTIPARRSPTATHGSPARCDHSVWLMPTVASAHAMKAALEAHPFFRDFLVHVAAGNRAGMGAEAKAPVDRMLNQGRPRRQTNHHLVGGEIDDRGDGAAVGCHSDSAIFEVAGSLFSGRVPGAITVDRQGR